PIPRDGPLAYAGLTLFAAGISLQAAAMRALGDFYTVRLGRQPGHRLVTSGPYRLIRHPGYLSYLLSMMGIGLALSSLIGLGLVALVFPFLLWRIRREEEMLTAEFDGEYKAYKKQTKWRLIPLVY
ncbi:MAG: isoprenylcysteine carboxylmethyltransferase family protein, partial [Dehalococcoidales bacterium]|nr:isoprenylcysteine carboxylmethyltransferase family protein [Dehalococcoidales bacterium]